MAAAHDHGLSTFHYQYVKQWFKTRFLGDSPKTLNILITGKTGVGKSRLVNALVGQNVATEGYPCTDRVASYEVIIENVKVTVWDSPGLQDGTSNESQYIQDMKEKVKDAALMIYCVNMDGKRFYEADKKAIKTLTKAFGKELWKHAIVVLTFANKVDNPDKEDDSEYFKMQLQYWKDEFHIHFAAIGINSELCASIPVIPAGNKKQLCLPDRENWLSELWIKCYEVVKPSSRLDMYQIKERLRFTGSTADDHGLSPFEFQYVEQLFNTWFLDDSPKTLNILITGKTGVGKSRLVNALVGQNVAEEGSELDPCTTRVISYEKVIENVKVTVWDSPGLQDGTSNESQYIQDMKEKVKDVDLMIYCIRMDDTRFYEADKKAIQTLTNEFGNDVWKHAIVVLTFANKVENPDKDDDSEYFKKKLQNWKKQLKGFIAVGHTSINSELCASIPLIPAGNNRKLRLPDREDWLSELWTKCYKVTKSSSRLGMYRINSERLSSTTLRSTTPHSTTLRSITPQTSDDDYIPVQIHLSPEQKKSFWKSTWESFTSFCKVVPKTALDVGWKLLKFLLPFL